MTAILIPANLRPERSETLALCALAHTAVFQAVMAGRDVSALRKELAAQEDMLVAFSKPLPRAGG